MILSDRTAPGTAVLGDRGAFLCFFRTRRASVILMAAALLVLPLAAAPGRSAVDEDYLMSGHNTARKVYLSASSVFSKNHRALRAMDQDAESPWISGPGAGPHWLSVDFGSKRLITSIVVRPGRKDNYRTLRSFTLQFYDNGWFDFATIPTYRKRLLGRTWEDRIEIDLGGVDASRFRIYIPPGAVIGDHAAIAEIEAYIGHARITFFDDRLKELCLPVSNGYLPTDDQGYPNAPRAYRGGRHAGVDIHYYHEEGSYDPLPVTEKTPILAVAGGIVVRADHNYRSPDIKEWNRLAAHHRTNGSTFMRHSFGGREVWIDHGNGIVTTYNHLSRIMPRVKKGSRVSRGSRIGYAGNSGLAGEAEGKKYGIHLHFEIWVDGTYLGYGMNIKDIRRYLNWIFFSAW